MDCTSDGDDGASLPLSDNVRSKTRASCSCLAAPPCSCRAATQLAAAAPSCPPLGTYVGIVWSPPVRWVCWVCWGGRRPNMAAGSVVPSGAAAAAVAAVAAVGVAAQEFWWGRGNSTIGSPSGSQLRMSDPDPPPAAAARGGGGGVGVSAAAGHWLGSSLLCLRVMPACLRACPPTGRPA